MVSTVSERSYSLALVFGAWLVSAIASAVVTYAAKDWLLFVFIAWWVAVMSAFVPKRPILRAVSTGIAVGVTVGLGILFGGP